MTIPFIEEVYGSQSGQTDLSSHYGYSDLVVKVDEQGSTVQIKSEEKGSSWFISGIILCNIMLGMGLLNMPEAYRNSGGIINAMCVQLVTIALIIGGYGVIAHCSDIYHNNSYQDTVERLCGRVSLILCSILIFVHNFGTCITFLVLLADQLDSIILYAYGPEFCKTWYLRRSVTMPVCSLLFVLPFCFAQRIDGVKLKIISVIGVLSTGYLMFLLVFKFYTMETRVDIVQGSKHWSQMLNAVPVICFSFEGHLEAVPLYACLKKRKMSEFWKAISVAMIISIFVYTLVGVYGYLVAGCNVTSDVLMAFYPPDIFIVIGTAVVALKSVTSYPCVFFCARLVTDDVFDQLCSRFDLSITCRRRMQAVFFFTVAVLVAILVPTIGSIIVLLGGSAALFILVYPGLCLMKAYLNWISVKELLLMILGVFLMVVGVYLAVTSTVTSVQIYIKEGSSSNNTSFCGLV